MIVIIAGSRGIDDYETVKRAIGSSGFKITEVVSGGCKGVDKLGERWAHENNIPIKVFKADWSIGKCAGPIRNHAMAIYGEALIAIWANNSRGTANMIDQAEQNGLLVYVYDAV